MDTFALYKVLSRYFRKKRYQWIREHFGDSKTVLDIGGIWHTTWSQLEFPQSITLLNIDTPWDLASPSNVRRVQGSGCSIPFRENTFDLAFSNSVIEHVGTWENQQAFAAEMLRVGKRVYCQTPNKWFPVEPHYLSLFWHWLPGQCFSYFVHRYLTVRGWLDRVSREEHDEMKRTIRLLTKRELKLLFPKCEIATEYFVGLPKSFAAYSDTPSEPPLR